MNRRKPRVSPLLAGTPKARAPLDVEALRRFVAIARAGSLTAAARALHVAQPALSRSLRALEEDLGDRLVVRTTRRLELTATGERLLAECVPLLEGLAGLRTLGVVDGLDLRGALRIGATDPVAGAVLPRAIATLMSRHARLHPFVIVAPTRDLVSRLERGELDVVLTFNPLRSRNVVTTPLATFRFHVVVARDRATSRQTCETFLGSREVEDERERLFPTFEAWRTRWPAARIRISTNSIAAQVELVRAGVGVAVLPEFAIHADLASGRLARTEGPELAFPLVGVRAPGVAATPVKALLDAVTSASFAVPGRVA